MWNIIIYDTWWLTFFNLVFVVPACWSVYQYFFPFDTWIFRCIVLHFVFPLISLDQLMDIWVVLSFGLEKEMATHSSILAWEIPWTEETGRLQGVTKSQTQLNNNSSDLLWIMLPWIFVYMCFHFSEYILTGGIRGSHGNFMFNILRNCQNVLQSGCTMLHFH